jgi:hypothetical protein
MTHSDGYPDAWFTRNFEQTGPMFQRKVCEYPNLEATTLIYHDHTMGITRLNNYAGLGGFYNIGSLLSDLTEEFNTWGCVVFLTIFRVSMKIRQAYFTSNYELVMTEAHTIHG